MSLFVLHCKPWFSSTLAPNISRKSRRCTFLQIIDYAATFHGEQEVVSRTVEGPTVVSTWAQIRERSALLTMALRRMGIAPGDRVATLAWNTVMHCSVSVSSAFFLKSVFDALDQLVTTRLPLRFCFFQRHRCAMWNVGTALRALVPSATRSILVSSTRNSISSSITPKIA